MHVSANAVGMYKAKAEVDGIAIDLPLVIEVRGVKGEGVFDITKSMAYRSGLYRYLASLLQLLLTDWLVFVQVCRPPRLAKCRLLAC